MATCLSEDRGNPGLDETRATLPTLSSNIILTKWQKSHVNHDFTTTPFCYLLNPPLSQHPPPPSPPPNSLPPPILTWSAQVNLRMFVPFLSLKAITLLPRYLLLVTNIQHINVIYCDAIQKINHMMLKQ